MNSPTSSRSGGAAEVRASGLSFRDRISDSRSTPAGINSDAMTYELGILVHGDNHFVVRGPLPDKNTAKALANHWSMIQIGAQTPPSLARWTISTREFRENLSWAVVIPGEGQISVAVAELLEELSVRGVAIDDFR